MRSARPAFVAPRPAMVGRTPMMPRGPVIVRPAPMMPRGPVIARPAPGFFAPNRSFFHSGFHRPFFPRHRFHHLRHGIFISSFGFPYGFYGYPPYYPSYPIFWDTYSGNSYAQQMYNQQAQQNYQLQQQVNQLSDEVERLSEQQAQMAIAPPAPPPSPSQPRITAPPPTPTTLVFRDGKTLQVQNYAIAGHTIWVFTEQRARKIPLAELNIPATQKANEERGVPFQVPPAR